tara:strand:+ start:1679 stop:1849 length:171 start_codon:yes stop_codon:yes gene_type:complete
MKDNYSIDEILSAVDEIQKKNKLVQNKSFKTKLFKKDYSDIPKHTLKLIEEAEEIN